MILISCQSLYTLRYVAELDPKDYEDDEIEDGLVDFPMDGGDNGDDDDGDSSGDDADDEDEDKEEEEEEHLAPADSAIIIPTDELANRRPRIDYGFVSTLDAEVRRREIGEVRYDIRDTWIDPTETVPEIAPMTVGKVNTRVTKLVELHEHDTQYLYALLEDAQDSRTRISQRVVVDSQRMQQTQTAELQETDRRHQTQMAETLRVMGDMRREMGDMQAELLALRKQPRRAG
nr:hypothetical protein [Tanacetum cinerariifolium]GFB16801.1 hypothetical protein [Tanacetum cinerariifolium]